MGGLKTHNETEVSCGQSEEEAVALATFSDTEVAHFIGLRQIKITFTISLMILAVYLFLSYVQSLSENLIL